MISTIFRSVVVRTALISAGLMALTACRPVDAALDCNTVCTRYKDCFDGDYNVESCATRCRNSAEGDTSYYNNLDRCEACITDRACASATFNCGSECSNVVP